MSRAGSIVIAVLFARRGSRSAARERFLGILPPFHGHLLSSHRPTTPSIKAEGGGLGSAVFLSSRVLDHWYLSSPFSPSSRPASDDERAQFPR